MKSLRHRSGFSLLDLCVLLFIVLFFFAGSARVAHQARDEANRIKCASNLKQIGLSIQLYANGNKGLFPRTTFEKSADPTPTEYTGVNAPDPFGVGGPGPNDVTSGLYLLLRDGEITGEPFICPISQSAGISPWAPTTGTMKSFSNFPSRAHLSYGYANPYPGEVAQARGFKMNWTLNSDFALAADMGPGNISANTPANATRAKMIQANSPNHRGDGQNVLYADGHCEWTSTIYVGSPRPVTNAPRDNIYAFGVDLDVKAASAGTRGSPQDQYDSVILPMADVGVQPGPFPGLVSPPVRWNLIIGSAAAATVIVALCATRLIRIRLKQKRLRASIETDPPGV